MEPQLAQPPLPPKQNHSPRIIVIGLLILGILIGIITLAILLNTNKSEPTKIEKFPGKIKIGYIFWPGDIGLYVARDKEFFKAEGVDVELVKYEDFSLLTDDYISGKIHGRANLSFDAVSEYYKGLDHKIVAVIDYSNGADGIIARFPITSIREIKGKKVAYEFGTLEEFFIVYALEQYGLTKADIKSVDLGPQSAGQAFVDGSVDVATTYEPYMSEALQKASGNKIFTTMEAPHVITDVLTFRSDFIKTYPDSVQAVVNAFFKGYAFWEQNPDIATPIIAKEIGVTNEEVKKQLEGVNTLNLKENEIVFSHASGVQSIFSNLRRVAEFIREQEGIEEEVVSSKIDILVDPQFVKKASVDY